MPPRSSRMLSRTVRRVRCPRDRRLSRVVSEFATQSGSQGFHNCITVEDSSRYPPEPGDGIVLSKRSQVSAW
ncbi:hypothetical protein Mapa_011871 [Marchantia paleacea]|nr:hypothetical protein Mapa_011871 [Marchantia paleacea]